MRGDQCRVVLVKEATTHVVSSHKKSSEASQQKKRKQQKGAVVPRPREGLRQRRIVRIPLLLTLSFFFGETPPDISEGKQEFGRGKKSMARQKIHDPPTLQAMKNHTHSNAKAQHLHPFHLLEILLDK